MMGVILLLMLVPGIIAYTRLTRDVSAEHDSVAGLAAIAGLGTAMTGHYVLAREQVVLGWNDRSLDAKVEAQTRDVAAAQVAYEATIASARDRELFDQCVRAWQAYLTAHRDDLAIARNASDQAAPRAAGRQSIDTAFGALLAALDASLDFNERNADESLRRIRADATSTTTAILASVFAGLVVALVGGYVVLGAVTQPLSHLTAAAGRSARAILLGAPRGTAATSSASSPTASTTWWNS
jgi:hypothetical protein